MGNRPQRRSLDVFAKNLLLVVQVQAYGLAALNCILTTWKIRAPNARPLDGAALEALEFRQALPARLA